MKKILPLFLLLLISCNPKGKIDFPKRVNAVKTAMEQKSLDSLSPYLANGYTIKGLPQGMESMILPLLFQKLPAPEKFTITSEKKEKKGTRLEVTFYYNGEIPAKADFLIAKDGKFLELNILKDAKISTTAQ